MIRFIIILLLLTSCTASRVANSKTIILDGSQSKPSPGQQIIHIQWRDINGTATIQNPNSLITKATVTKSTTFELFGQQTDGESAKDSVNVNY